MDDLPGLTQRAKILRSRIAEFIRNFGPEMIPEMRELHTELARIEDSLQELGQHAPDEESRS